MDPDSLRIIETIQKEHRSTRRVFGISIIILALLLAVLAPSVIRTTFRTPFVSEVGESSPPTPLESEEATTTPQPLEEE